MGQMYVILKYNELYIVIPIIIMNKLVCDIVLEIVIARKMNAQINLSNASTI